MKKSVPELLAEATHSIARIDVWRQYKIKDDKTGKESLDLESESGTGFVIRCEHLGGNNTTDDVEFDVVTNNHVFGLSGQHEWVGSARLLCTVYGLSTKNATILGTDALSDLAVIRVRAHPLKNEVPKALSWADPKSIRVGDDVVAIGFARDLRGEPTVTRGIVSAKRRTEPTTGSDQGLFADLIQTDASINHGNSGGPLLNMRGEVLGVNTYLIPPEVAKDAKGNVPNVDVTQDIFFTRSSRTARPFVEQIVRSGKVSRLNLGCSDVTFIEPLIRFFGWPQAVCVRCPRRPPGIAGRKGRAQSRRPDHRRGQRRESPGRAGSLAGNQDRLGRRTQ